MNNARGLCGVWRLLKLTQHVPRSLCRVLVLVFVLVHVLVAMPVPVRVRVRGGVRLGLSRSMTSPGLGTRCAPSM